MKTPAILPAGLCVAAGLLLMGYALCEYFIQKQSNFDMVSFAIGLYFAGKGIFIHSVLGIAGDIRDKR